MKTISAEDVKTLREIFLRLKKFDDTWSHREDDPEDMLIEAPEMVADLMSKMGTVMERLEEP